MTQKELSRKIFDLLLASKDSTANWKNDVILYRLLWWLMSLLLLWGFVIFISNTFIVPSATENLTLIIRIANLVLVVLITVILTLFTYRYYILIVFSGYKIYLSHVLFFYFASTLLYANIYFFAYTISPSLFIYIDSPYIPQRIISSSGNIDFFKSRLEFFLYSGFHGSGGSYNKIQSASILVSLISLIQSLYILSLITLFISSFINQNIGKVKK